VLGGLVDGDWSEAASWDTAVAVVEGFMDYWERNRAVFRVVELTTVEGDLRFQGLRVRALNAVTVTLAVSSPPRGMAPCPGGVGPMAAAGTLIAMLAQVAVTGTDSSSGASGPRPSWTARPGCSMVGHWPAGSRGVSVAGAQGPPPGPGRWSGEGRRRPAPPS